MNLEAILRAQSSKGFFDCTLLAFVRPTWALGTSLLDSTQPKDYRPLVFLDHLCTEKHDPLLINLKMLLP